MVEQGESVTTFEVDVDDEGSLKRASLPDVEMVRRVDTLAEVRDA